MQRGRQHACNVTQVVCDLISRSSAKSPALIWTPTVSRKTFWSSNPPVGRGQQTFGVNIWERMMGVFNPKPRDSEPPTKGDREQVYHDSLWSMPPSFPYYPMDQSRPKCSIALENRSQQLNHSARQRPPSFFWTPPSCLIVPCTVSKYYGSTSFINADRFIVTSGEQGRRQRFDSHKSFRWLLGTFSQMLRNLSSQKLGRDYRVN